MTPGRWDFVLIGGIAFITLIVVMRVEGLL